MKKFCAKNSGFTIIEVLIYIAIYALIMTGMIVSIFTIIESEERVQTEAMVEEEGSFIIAKTNWVLNGAKTVKVINNSQMIVDRSGIASTDNPVLLEVADGIFSIKFGSAPSIPLNNTNTKVSNQVFSYTSGTGDGINEERLMWSFDLSAFTPNGSIYSRNFSNTKYLKR